jgi:hypothetical protein
MLGPRIGRGGLSSIGRGPRKSRGVVRESLCEMRRGICTFSCSLCFLFTSCMNLYICVEVGSGCSHSFRGTAREFIFRAVIPGAGQVNG